MDVVARRSVLAWRRALRPGGIYLVIGGTAARIVQVAIVGSVVSLAGSRTMRLLVARLGDTADLTTLLRLVEDGTVRPVVDQVVGLDEAPDCFPSADGRRGLREGRARALSQVARGCPRVTQMPNVSMSTAITVLGCSAMVAHARAMPSDQAMSSNTSTASRDRCGSSWRW